MKRLFLLFSMLLACAMLHGQNAYTTEVHLKNGSIIKGFVVEHNPQGNIKVQTADGSLFVYDSNEVERVVSGSSQDSQTSGYNTERGGKMFRKKNHLHLDGKPLTEADAQQLFEGSNFNTYLSARKQCRVGRGLVAGGWTCVGVGAVSCFISVLNSTYAGQEYNSNGELVNVYELEPITALTGIILLVGGDIMLPTGYIIRGIGRGRLSRLAEGYNEAQAGHASSLQFSPALMTTANNKKALGVSLNLLF